MNEKKMMIKISPSPCGWGWNSRFKAKIGRIAGRWVKVETTFLFDDQYNVKELRVMDCDVVDIINDLRPNRYFCTWCHGNTEKDVLFCPHCFQIGYLRPFIIRAPWRERERKD